MVGGCALPRHNSGFSVTLTQTSGEGNTMELSKRRERELHKLSTDASDLWHKQRDLFGRAGELLREAGRSAGDIGRDEVYPKTRDSLEHALAPALSKIRRAPQRSESKTGPGAYILMAIGAATVAVIGYAVWSTLRSDEDLWVETEDE